MNQEYLDNLIYAKESLKIWVSDLKQNDSGKQMVSTGIELTKADTEFAKWYYGQGQTFSSFEAFRNIENYYNNLYDNILEYTDLNSKPIKKSFFSNSAGKKKKELLTILDKIDLSYNEVLERVNFFQDTLLNSPLFADSKLEKNTLEETSLKSKSEIDFFNDPNTITEEKEFIEFEGAIEFDDVNETLDERAIQLEDNEVEGKFSFDSNELNEFLNQDPQEDNNETSPFEINVSKEIEEALPLQIEEIEKEVDLLSLKQTEDKKAILENSNIKKIEKKIASSNITPEIDIEEEIRRILS